MRSKYLVIRPSTEVNANGENYPDVMTFPINKFLYNDIPTKAIVSSVDIIRFDLFCYSYYSTAEFTDLLLWLNDLSSVHDLTVGMELTLPSLEDINSFLVQYV